METLYLSFLLAVLPALVFSQNSYEKLKPSSYHLKITIPDNATSNTFQGHIELKALLTKTSSNLVLDAEQLTIADHQQDVSVSTQDMFGESFIEKIKEVTFTKDTLIISFTKSLSASPITININFTGTFQDEMKGFAKVPFFFNKSEKFLGVTSFEPNFAQRVFPCSTDPSIQANIILEVTVDYSQIVLSNVKPTVHNISDTARVFVFNSYPAMPIHQLGWAVFDHTTYALHVRNITDSKQIHTRSPGRYASHTTWACQFSRDLSAKLGDYLNHPYPLDKLEQIVIPEFFSGTSKGYGIISYSEEAILVSPNQTSSTDKQRVALTLAEGIIEQWFGDYVSVNSWNNMWIVKGLSEYLKYYFTSTLDEVANWELNDHVVVELVQKALALDSENNSLTIESQDEITTIETAYSTATTYKAASILRMLHTVLGKDVFKTSLQYYVFAQSQSQGKEGTPEDFWNLAYSAGRREVDLPDDLGVSDIMSGWVTMKGHPTVRVNSNESFYLLVQPKGTDDPDLYIQVTCITKNSPSDVKRIWLKSDIVSAIPKLSPDDWILVNVDQTGFYRVIYNEIIWSQLQEQLMVNHQVIPRISRSQLVDDVFALTFEGVISMDFLMNFTKYLSKEVDYFPWHTALRNFQTLLDGLYGSESYTLFQKHLLSLMEAVITTVGLNDKSMDSHTNKMRQSLVLEKACALGHVECQRKAVSILDSWMHNTYYDADLNMALMCAGVANSPVDTWWKLHQSYSESIYPTVRAHILTALSCSTNTALMNEFLTNQTLSSTPPLIKKDQDIFLETLASTPAGADLILNWMINTLSPESTNTTVNTEPVSTQVTEAAPTESITNSSNVTSDSNDTLPTLETDATTSNTSDLAVPINRTKRQVSELTTLSDNQVRSILSLIVPKLTTNNQGVKLERLLNTQSLPISNDTRLYVQNITMQIYENENATAKYNEKLTVWLSYNIDSTTTVQTEKPTADSSGSTAGGSTTPKPNAAPGIHSSQVLLVITAILLSCTLYL